MQDILNKAKIIKLLICDVDGVMTDGQLFLGDDLIDLPVMRKAGLSIAVAD